MRVVRFNYKQNQNETYVIQDCWKIINSILLENKKYRVRENHKRGDFDFNIRRHFHGFISFGNIDDNKVNFGIWFTKKEKGLPYVKTILIELNKKTNYVLEVTEYQKTGCIFSSIAIPNKENAEEEYKNIYEFIDGLLDYFIELNIWAIKKSCDYYNNQDNLFVYLTHWK